MKDRLKTVTRVANASHAVGIVRQLTIALMTFQIYLKYIPYVFIYKECLEKICVQCTCAAIISDMNPSQ